MLFSKEHLDATNDYNWTEELVFTGTPTRRLFDRHNGHQLLLIINSYAQQTEEFSEGQLRRIEDLLMNQLPVEAKSEISVLKWLMEHEEQLHS